MGGNVEYFCPESQPFLDASWLSAAVKIVELPKPISHLVLDFLAPVSAPLEGWQSKCCSTLRNVFENWLHYETYPREKKSGAWVCAFELPDDWRTKPEHQEQIQKFIDEHKFVNDEKHYGHEMSWTVTKLEDNIQHPLHECPLKVFATQDHLRRRGCNVCSRKYLYSVYSCAAHGWNVCRSCVSKL